MLLPVLIVIGSLCVVMAAEAQTDTPAADAALAPARRFVVTLLSSFEPIPEKLVPTDVPERVYRTQGTVFGQTIYFVRAGFFASRGEAEAAKARLLARYSAAYVTEIAPEEYAAAAGVAPPTTLPATTAPKPAPVLSEELYAITLATGGARAPTPAGPLPKSLRSQPLYAREQRIDGKPQATLNLGFFSSAAEAEKARRLLLRDYPKAQVRTATAAERAASADHIVAIPSPAPATGKSLPGPAIPPVPVAPSIAAPTLATPTVTTTASADIEAKANSLMDQARNALTRGDNQTALQSLSQLLRLPPNNQAQEAQELVGLAYERIGDMAAAKREYRLYMQLYPEGPGSDRVRQRLANIEAIQKMPALKVTDAKAPSVFTTYGSLSQYYYHGDTHTDTTTLVGPTLNQSTLTATDQSALITDLNLNARYRSGDYDNRVVVRENYLLNFLPDQDNRSRLYAAYYELRNKAYDYSGRIGRQPGNSGGVLGHFDGISAGYSVLPKWRVNLVAGTPVDFYPINSDKQFWGASLDLGTFDEHWNGSAYYINQTVDGIIDRQAVGAELRYFDPRGSLIALTDYDISYGELNIFMLQSTWQTGTSTTWNVLADHRKAPVLTTSNAVIGEPDTSIQSQLTTQTEDQLRAEAVAKTPTADLLMLGVAHNLTPRWQLGGDVKLYKISGTQAAGSLPATDGTGNVLVYTLQGIATGLLTQRDISVLSLSYLDNRSYTGESVSITNRTIYRDRWTGDFALRYYTQQNSIGTDMTRWNPSIRLGYAWRQRLTFEGEIGIEKARTSSAMDTQTSMRRYYTLGYRWDF